MSMHILRNPHGFSEDEVRAARLWAGDEIERLERALKEIVQIPDGTTWEEIGQLATAIAEQTLAGVGPHGIAAKRKGRKP